MSGVRDWTPAQRGQHARPKRRTMRLRTVGPARKTKRGHYRHWPPFKINSGTSAKGTQVL